MAVDFMIDDRGDFFLSNINQYERLRIDWIDSTYPTLRLDFEQGEEQVVQNPNDNQLCIDFITIQTERSLDAKVPAVMDIQELRQRCIIAIRTEYGEMRLKPKFGSYIVTQRHRDIMSEEVQANVQQIVLTEVSDILTNPSVTVLPRKKEGPFYCQNLNVYVYEDGNLLFDIEV